VIEVNWRVVSVTNDNSNKEVFIAHLHSERRKHAFICAGEGAKKLACIAVLNVNVKKKWQSAICTRNYCPESIKNLS